MNLLLDPPIAPSTDSEHSYYKIYRKDPSPWLPDSKIWSKLLWKIANGEGFDSLYNMKALGELHAVRRFGVTIKWDLNRGHFLIPVLDITGVWDTLEYWEECRIKFLAKYNDIWNRWFTFINSD